MMPPAQDDYDPRPWLEAQPWTYATTVPQHPHEYLLAERSTDPAEHYRMIRWVNAHGEVHAFAGHRYRYAEVAGYLYWVSRGGDRLMLNRRRADWDGPPPETCPECGWAFATATECLHCGWSAEGPRQGRLPF